MSDYKAIYKVELETACNSFAKALRAVESRKADNWTMEKKGKTLNIVNRARIGKVKLTVNY